MPNLGPLEMVFIGVVLLLIFGAKRLPELGAGLGKGIREFKKSVNEIKHEVSTEDNTQQIRSPNRPQVSPPPAAQSQPPVQQPVEEEVPRKDA